MLSGLLLLVPGSVAVTGFFLFLQKDNTGGVGLAMGMLMVALALAMGIFLSSLLVKHDETKVWFAQLQALQKEAQVVTKRSDLVF